LTAVLALPLVSTELMGQAPKELIGDAAIRSVTPTPLVPGQPFFVTVGVTLKRPVARKVLFESLRVFVDAVPGTLLPSEAPGELTEVADASDDKQSITLFGTVPMTAPAPWVPRPPSHACARKLAGLTEGGALTFLSGTNDLWTVPAP
jgi:hypothetical protein